MNEISYSPDQADVIESIRKWLNGSPRKSWLSLGGLAGTGKTTIIAHLAELLERRVIYCAPTGKAASVLSRKLGQHVGTVHGLLYKPMEEHCEDCERQSGVGKCHADAGSYCGCTVSFFRNGGTSDSNLIVVDEASMVDKRMFNDLMEYADSNPVLFVGDHGQLPPVGSSFDLMKSPDLRLERIHRQAEDSPILELAQKARNTGMLPYGRLSDKVMKLHRDEAKGVIDYNDDDTMVLVYTNDERTAWNAHLRRRLGYKGPPQPGERLICLRNNWRVGVVNGTIGKLLSRKRYPTDKDAWFLEVDTDSESLYRGAAVKAQFGNPKTYQTQANLDLWDYGYCLTTHKAQGSQAKRVIVIESRLSFLTDDIWKRWLYTAVTRAEDELYVIGD